MKVLRSDVGFAVSLQEHVVENNRRDRDLPGGLGHRSQEDSESVDQYSEYVLDETSSAAEAVVVDTARH